MAQDTKLRFEFESANDAIAFSESVRSQNSGPGFHILTGKEGFTSESHLVELAIKFVDHGGIEAITAVATLLSTVLEQVRGRAQLKRQNGASSELTKDAKSEIEAELKR